MAFSMKGPGGPRPSRTESGNSDGSDDWQSGRNESDESFKQTIGKLSSQLNARFAVVEPPDPDAPEPESVPESASDVSPDESFVHPFRERPRLFRLSGARRADLVDEPPKAPSEQAPTRGRTLRLLLGFTLGATAAIAALSAFHSVTHQNAIKRAAPASARGQDVSAVVPSPPLGPKPPSDVDIANSKSADKNSESTAKPVLDPPSGSDSPASSTSSSQATAAPTPSPAAAAPANVDQNRASADHAPLAPYEIMEVQTRLQWLGFSPGGLDGVSGHLTAAAVRRYEAAKGLPQTGNIDKSLLAQLRRDSLRPSKP